MKKIILLIIVIFIVSIPAWIYTQTMSDYCSAPPFVTRTVPSNIMILIDNSNDMGQPAYEGGYFLNPDKPYYGYFDPKGCYNPNVSNKFQRMGAVNYSIAGQEITGCPSGQFNGNILNWALMSRLSLLKKVIMGGKFEPRPTDPQRIVAEGGGWEKTEAGCKWEIKSSGGNISLTVSEPGSPGTCSYPKGGSWGVTITRTTEESTGIFQEFTDKSPKDNNFDKNSPRFGVTDFGTGGPVIDMMIPPNNYENYFTAIQNLVQRASSPLATAHKAVIDYFTSPPSTQDPYKSCASWESSCTDGNPVICRKSFILMITSGTDVSGNTVASTSGCFQTDPLVRNACYAFNTDLRLDINSPPKQNIYTYVVHTRGTASNQQVLKDTAAQGGGKYYEAGEGDLKAVLMRAMQDILAQAASGTAVSVLTTSSRGAGSVVQAYFLPIKQEGTREVWWTGYMQNIWIDPNDNLREDSVHDYKLILDQDKVMKLYFNPNNNETEAALFTTSADGNGGTFSTCSGPEIKQFANVQALWEAGKKLALKNPSERTIFTSKKIIRETTATTFTEMPYPEFKTIMNATLKNALNPDTTYTADKIISYIRGECLETDVAGDTSCSNTINPLYRDRRLTVDGSLRVWKLGDIISSTPKVFANTPLNTYHIDYADKTYYDYISSSDYKNKSSGVFVGANDGMLHAFRVGYLKDKDLTGSIKALFKNFFGSSDGENDRIGEEMWAYIPFNAFPYLKYLADPNYCHIYYSDLSVRLIDASINGSPGSTKDQNSWKTILIGGMRFGGACGLGGIPADSPAGTPANVGFSSYFALDITDPENPIPLWEFSDTDMGYATTFPSIIRTGDRNHNGSWYVVFGSGSKVLPKGGIDIGRNTTGYIYILNLRTGELVKKISLDHNAIVGDILAIDAEKNYISEKIYFGTAYKPGTTWMGKLVSIDIPEVLATSGVNISWSSSFGKILFSGNYPFTASPDAAKDTKGNIWVFSGSGKYYSDLDESDTSQQIFFGLKDKGLTVVEGNLSNTTNIQTTGDVTRTAKVCAYDISTNSFGLKDMVTSIKLKSTVPSVGNEGWKIYFVNRERMISRPLAVGGLMDFLTYKPDADPCKYGGDSYLYSVGYTTGVAPSCVAIRSPEATSGVSGTVTVYKGIRLGPGAPPTGEAIITPPQKEGIEQLKKKIQTATGVIVESENQPAFSIVSKIMHWLKK